MSTMQGFEGQAFLLEADKEYLAARLLLNAGIAISSKGTYHAHTALEQILKAYLVEVVGQMRTGHDLVRLATECQASGHSFFSNAENLKQLEAFNAYQQLGRYGANSNRSSDPLSVDTPELQTRGVVFLTAETQDSLDRLYLNIRVLLPTKQINALKAIVDRQPDHMINQAWKLSTDAFEVLTSQNKFTEIIN